jgi:hypothetical protein
MKPVNRCTGSTVGKALPCFLTNGMENTEQTNGVVLHHTVIRHKTQVSLLFHHTVIRHKIQVSLKAYCCIILSLDKKHR